MLEQHYLSRPPACRAILHQCPRNSLRWRSIIIIGARCLIRAPRVLEKIIAHGVKAGWLNRQDGHSVVPTEAGRRL